MSQQQLAAVLGVSSDAIKTAEAEGRYFRQGKIQLKASMRIEVAPVQTTGLRNCHCGYCHKIIERQSVNLRRSKSRSVFCSKSHVALYRWHGPMPLPTPAPFGSTVPAINPRIERARKSRKADLWRGMDKTLREAQEAKQ